MAIVPTSETFNFELVSPERKVISEPVTMAVIPGSEGELGVLANHSPLIAALKPGVVEIYAGNDNTPRRVFIAGGFADVTATQCTVLAEEAVNVQDLNQAEIEQAVRDLTEDVASAANDIEKSRFQRRLTVAQAKLQAVTGVIAAA